MFKAIVGTIGTNVGIQALSMVSSIWVARMLGPAGRGEFAVALFWPALFATLGVVGTDVSLARSAARYPNIAFNLRLQAVKMALILGCISIVVCGLALPWLLPGKKAYLLPVAYLLLLYIPGAMINLLLFSIELGRGQHKNYNLARLGFSIAYLFTIGIVVIRDSVETALVAAALVSATVLSALFTSILTKWNAPCQQGGGDGMFSVMRLIREGLPFGASTLISSMSAQLPMLILINLAETREIGIFVVAYTVSALHQAIGGAFGKVLFGAAARRQENKIQESMLTVCRLMVGMYFLLALVLAVIMPPLVPLVFGDKYKEAVAIVGFLVFATSFVAISEIYDEILKGMGIWKAGLVGRVASGVTLVVVATYMVPMFHLLGMVAAIAASAIIQFIVLVVMMNRVFKAHWRDVAIMSLNDLSLVIIELKKMVGKI